MQKTDLNVTPYYDDFTETDNFHRVLFRPGYSVQARELTQMQSILQNQIERVGKHFFKEGSVIVPGSVGTDVTYSFVTLQETFSSEQVELYRTSLVDHRLTGVTSGVVAKVVNTVAATDDDALTLYIKYEATGTSQDATTGGVSSFVFADGEYLKSDTGITFTGASASVTHNAGANMAQVSASSATGTGCNAHIEKGIFFIRGQFVQTTAQTLILDKYTNTPSYRIGFVVSEALVTPEENADLLDNATGTTNYAAKGAHRLKISLTLASKSLGTADDADFIELMSIKNGAVQSAVRNTEYSVLEDTLARRTHDESGDYIVRGFDIDLREHYDDGLNNGVFTTGDSSKIAIALSPGKAYVRGHEISTISTTFTPMAKARETNFVQNAPTTFSAGNYLQVENTCGTPDIDSSGTVIKPFRKVEILDKRAQVTHIKDTSGINANVTAMDVDSSTGFPAAASGNSATHFIIRIDNELLKVTNISGVTWTVVRGYYGSENLLHAEDAKVTMWGTTHTSASTIGLARTRAFEHKSGTYASANTGFFGAAGGGVTHTSVYDNAIWKHYLIDVKFFCKLTLVSALSSSSFLHNGGKITGQTSGATGFVYINDTDGSDLQTGTTVNLIQTTGTFTTGESITCNIDGDIGGSTVALHGTTAPVYFSMNDAHGLKVESDGADYISDIYPADGKVLTGTVTATEATTTLKGTNTGFISDLKAGDLFEVQDDGGTVRRFEVASITDDTTLITVQTFADDLGTGSVTGSLITRVRSKLEEQEELVMLSKLPKATVKTLKPAELNNTVDTTLTVRRQSIVTLSSSGAGSIILPAGESFKTFTDTDYSIVVHSEGSGGQTIYPAGIILSPVVVGTSDMTSTLYETKVSGFGTTTLNIQVDGANAVVLKITYTVTVATASEKTKTLNPMAKLHVRNDEGNPYGTNFKDRDISLNYADIFKVRAVYEATAADTDAVAPTLIYNNGTSSVPLADLFTPGQTVVAYDSTGTTTTGAQGRVLDGGSSGSATATMQFVALTDKSFAVGNIIKGNDSSATLTLTGTTTGDTNILSNYTVDNGQRDTFYDVGKITRKPASDPPNNRLYIVYDYFTHGAGDYFSVDSYPVGTSYNNITYSDIPMYSAQRVDPDTIAPTGEYDLRDTIDFRPRVGDYTITIPYASGTTQMTDAELDVNSISPLIFSKRSFESTGSSLVDVPKTDDTFITSFNFYLPKIATLFLDSDGKFRVSEGASAENPDKPSSIPDAIKMASFIIPPYTFEPLDVQTGRIKNRRFTMKDIGSLQKRVENLEYYTQLNLLEKDTQSFQMQDADGLDRFKNGFIVDNFTGHGTGDALHPDYKNSMDMANGMLRPEFYHRMLGINESVSTDALRTSAGYQKTGDLLSLPYTHAIAITQPYASRIENVNPFNVMAWIGSIELNPESDIWRDTNRLPNLIVNQMGNYDTFIARNGGSAINTVWNEWETFWTGEEQVGESQIWRDTNWDNARATVPFRRLMERTMVRDTGYKTRSGVRTTITPKIDYESKGDKVVSTDILPYCRAKDIAFTGQVFKPKSRLFAFFDNVNVSAYITPNYLYVNKWTGLNGAHSAGATTVTVTSTSVFSTSGGFVVNSTAGVATTVTYTNKTGTTFTGCSGMPAANDEAVVYKVPSMGDPLISGATGKTAGTFSLPDPNVTGNPAFKVGERTFRLTSDNSNATLQGDTQTAGEATYYAKGLLDNIQETIIATKNASISSEDANSGEIPVVGSTRPSDRQVGWWDPLAQSFLVDDAGGMFMTKVEVYFQSKSTTVPCQCQIRTMVNGYPSTTILPFGTAVAEPSEVQVSDDASLSTTFTFPSPVYLMQDIEYCFVIMANTQDYLIWLSHMGDVEVGGSRTISDQPYAGVLFKSQNASTWTAAQMEDLKFNVHRASFTTNSDGIVTFQNDEIPERTLGNNPITTIPGTKKVLVKHPNHGMYSRSKNYVQISNWNGTANLTTGNTTYDLTNLGAMVEFSSLEEVGIDHYVVDLTGKGTTAMADTFKDAKSYGGTTMIATENYMMDTAKLTIQSMEVPGTSIITSVRSTSGTSPSSTTGGTDGGDETSFNLLSTSSAANIVPNQNVFFEEPKLIASGVNETNNMSQTKSFHALCTLSTESENISPVLDVQRLGIMPVQNRLNSISVISDHFSTAITTTTPTQTIFSDQYAPSTSPEGDNNSAVYITRKVPLENSSTALKTIFEAYRHSSASIDVYYKTLRADDTAQFEDLNWTSMTIDKTVNESKMKTDFRENTYEVSGLDSFIAFAIKLVLRGTKTTEPPLIKDFRTIALAL